MIDKHNQPIVLRNLVRLYAFEFLVHYDLAATKEFSYMFAIWSPSTGLSGDADRSPIHRLCDFLWDYFSYGLDRSSPYPETLYSVYFKNANPNPNGYDTTVEENSAKSGYSFSKPMVTLEQSYDLLKNEGFDPSSPESEALIRAVAFGIATNFNIVLQGESGVGKRRLARIIHRLGIGSSAPLIFIQASDLGPRLITSRIKTDCTLVINEIFRLSPDASEAMNSIFDNPPREKLARIIATTSNNLEILTDQNQFSASIYYRLAIITVDIPPLRDRLADIPELVQFFLDRRRSVNKNIVGESLSAEAINKLKSHSWPRNFPELRSVLRSALRGCPDKVVGAEYISFSPDDSFKD